MGKAIKITLLILAICGACLFTHTMVLVVEYDKKKTDVILKLVNDNDSLKKEINSLKNKSYEGR